MEISNSIQSILPVIALKDGVKSKDIADVIKHILVIDVGTRVLPRFIGHCLNQLKNIIHKPNNQYTNDITNIPKTPKMASIQIHRIYEKTNENDTFDAIIWRLCQIPQTKHLKLASNGIYVLSNQDIIHIEEDMYVQQISVNYDEKKAVTESTIEIFSYSSDLLAIKEYISDLVHKFNLHRNNQLGQMIYYFDEIPTSLPRLMDGNLNYNMAPKFMTFSMSKMMTNKNLENVYGSAMDIVRKRVKFFMNNKKWYQEKGVPYTLGILMYGDPGCGKTSLIKALSKDCQRHIFNIRLSESTTISQVNTLFFTERVTTVVDGVNHAYNIPLDKRIIVLEDIDCLSDIVLDRQQQDTKQKNELLESFKSRLMSRTMPQNTCNSGVFAESTRDVYSYSHGAHAGVSMDTQLSGIQTDTTQKLTLSYLLNVLDGVLETPGRIVIMTSNYPEKLDKALIRPGRIDLKVHFNKCTRADIIEMIEKITQYTPTSEDMFGIEDFKWSPAEVTQKIFEAMDGDIHTVIDSLKSVKHNPDDSDCYILYKKPNQSDTLSIVQYLHSLGYENTTPAICIEHDHPKWVTTLPSIETASGDKYIGIEECTRYYIERYDVKNTIQGLLDISKRFKEENPEYRIH